VLSHTVVCATGWYKEMWFGNLHVCSSSIKSHIELSIFTPFTMKLTITAIAAISPTLIQAVAINKRQNEIEGNPDATQTDLSARPPHRFPFPVTTFPIAQGDVVSDDTIYVAAGTTFDCEMKRYSRPEGFCNEQAEGTDADAVFNLLPGSTLRNCIIGKDQSEGIHALGDAWVENGDFTY
jgi:hypothetical protein